MLAEEGVIDVKDLDLFRFVETAEEAWNHVQDFYAPAAKKAVA